MSSIAQWARAGLRSLRASIGAIAPTFIVIAALEIVLRIGACVAHGGSQYYLFYGFQGLMGRVGISPWSVYDGGYYKFPSNYVLEGLAGQGDRETASINSLGFRGADFEPRKPAGTFRIIALGESSTFGFHDTDTGTYPVLLERLLRKEDSPLEVEVINAGFPYYNSASILSLLTNELANYDPDLLTLYNGYNDACWPLRLPSGYHALVWVQEHSAIYLVLKESVLTDIRVLKLRERLPRRFAPALDRAVIDQEAEAVAARYRRNVLAIAAFARDRDIPLILIRQPMTSDYRGGEKNPDYTSYEAEYRIVREKLENGGLESSFEHWLLLHHRIIDEVDAIVREEKLPVVDNIAIVDRNRARLGTHVHLTEEANARLAEALEIAVDPFLAQAARRAAP